MMSDEFQWGGTDVDEPTTSVNGKQGHVVDDPMRPEASLPSLPLDFETLLTTKQAAAILGVTEKGLRAMALAGKVAFYRLGRGHRYNRSDLRGMLVRVEHKR